MTDLAEQIAQGVYGKSGRANAPDNDNPSFRAGFAVGMKIEDVLSAITQEWIRIGSPDYPPKSFKEWKRGMWSAHLQKIIAQIKPDEFPDGRK